MRALRPDGARVRSTNGESECLTRWEKGLLRVETWHDDGVHVEEIFDLAPDRSLLTVTVLVDDGGSAIALERVFRPDGSDKSGSVLRSGGRLHAHEEGQLAPLPKAVDVL